MRQLAVLLLFLIVCSTSNGQLSERIVALQKENGLFVIPNDDELLRVERLFERVLRRDDFALTANSWAKEGMLLERLNLPGAKGWLLSEKEDEQRGRGVFFIKDGEGKVFLQAPHSFFDKGTGLIVSSLIEENDFAGAAWNTVPRYALQNNYKGPADTQAHDRNYFVAFARAFARCRKVSHLVQLHGFAAKKRKTDAGKRAGAIVSGGTRTPRALLFTVVVALKLRLPKPVLLYPLEVKELGATKNVCGSTLRRLSHNGFVHIELNGNLRKELITDAKLRSKLANGLIKYLN